MRAAREGRVQFMEICCYPDSSLSAAFVERKVITSGLHCNLGMISSRRIPFLELRNSLTTTNRC